MDAILLSLLTGLLSGALSAVVTYFATVSKIRVELSVEYDKELHKQRLEAYQKLWPEFKTLARYSRAQPITYQIIRETSEKMMNWYFDTGGIFLSAKSRKPYFDLKAAMQEFIDEMDEEKELQSSDVRIKPMLDFATALRASLSEDIGTRRKPLL